jgi:hypothetical protein
MAKPRVFLGSAAETRGIVDALEAELRDVAFIERWDVDVFRPGHFTLEELTRAVRQVDFAAFVLGGDDLTESRGKTTPSPRDNVIFEAGLFTAVLGRERTFYIVDKAGTKIPSDWAGLGYLMFDASEERERDKVYDAVAAIRRQLSAWKPTAGLGPLATVVGEWWQYVVNLETGAVLSWLEIAATEPANLQLTGNAWSIEGRLLARYRSQSARFDADERTLYYSWEGEHPRDQAIPHFFGVGEIAFRDVIGGVATSADGWFSSSSSSDVTNSLTKSTTYLRPSADETGIMRGTDRDQRAALIQTKLAERRKLNV